ncbi:dolichyl pyrophosphate Man9GlcNAc2 alpha-1,3-glucosyltransferase [Tribolium castaneum]|uniref:Alpha-1,3-glucosyltransferase n=1 Tax=Tribolium castaneum TaxID=7070 RepID=D2A4Q9_TRICA|nr:PREDICTED: dolichyl pyrophosphate Man9GlcNAc2 alpha-1,3-glucosyltransferase [Tribolium castaneum]EFA05255.1 putative dolichyl pyrophosphate Man9GlcNAc2 alpha-1,3-glucosyltransferase-like Protein [Tribolium castaneum]|eukprot:XP_972276.1 PREDICTED: dolichyl pyrophosphate Man9GlcNAc2 alpha-1,3-glucosyltransferase [Tribolium castaneum]
MFCVKLSCEVWLVILGALVAVLLRACTTLHPYSGAGSPPMYGDYEAQRHWMEITTNLRPLEWYKNTTDNDLMYWGLDYPPLTAYHMYLTGKIGSFLNENWTKLHESRGFEGESHKIFMRYTVLAADIVMYIPALIFYFHAMGGQSPDPKTRPLSPSLATILGLLYPGIILIDHGHFQYNCISLGLLVLATSCLLLDMNLTAAIFFTSALNYKQMELYHALPFFMYMLSSCVPKPGQSLTSSLIKLAQIAITVMAVFAILWAPFNRDFFAVLRRLFPLDRGVFEDKVSNFWCVFNIFYKLKLKFGNYEMMRICLFATVSMVFPSSVDLFLRPSRKKFVLSLINSSLAFFLFSYQVHEKSILLVGVPVVLYFPQKPFVCFWFLCISVFSMLPLLYKDGLIIATIALMLFYVISFRVSIEHFYRSSLNASDGLAEYYRSLLHVLLDIEYKQATQIDILKLTYKQIVKNKETLKNLAFHVVLVTSLIGCLVLSFALLVFEPPERYPDLFPLLISAYSALHFFGFFLYFNVKQLQIPQEFDAIKNVKIKSS